MSAARCCLPARRPGQRPQRGTPQPATTAPQPGDEVVAEPPAQKINNPTAVFAGLDKITGRIISFDVAINETVQFGALQVTPRVCYTRPPTETPNTDAFAEVDEVTLQGEIRRIFTGWMFASSPGTARGRARDLRHLADRLQRRRSCRRGRAAGARTAAASSAPSCAAGREGRTPEGSTARPAGAGRLPSRGLRSVRRPARSEQAIGNEGRARFKRDRS